MESVKTYLGFAVKEGASDLLIIAGKELLIKKNGEMVTISKDRLMPQHTEVLIKELYTLAGRSYAEEMCDGDDDFSLSITGMARFRVNVYRQRGSIAATIRIVSFGIPDWKELGIDKDVMTIAQMTSGLVLITGPSGSGKSTTLACIVDAINQTRNAHIITIEDPIEYLHRNAMGVVSQREIAIDTTDYLKAFKASLRQAPDVIVLGEMREAEAAQAAMSAAESGRLVISTMHTHGAVNTLESIIDMFPAIQQQQVRLQMNQSLRLVVSQQLIPGADGRIPVFEIMYMNPSVQILVREGKTERIDSVIQTSASQGMRYMDDAILELYKKGYISRYTALRYAVRPLTLQSKLN